MNFKYLTISEWQQFQNVEIDFHDRLTILTGANGSGKTTILAHVLAKHYGWEALSLSTPKKDYKSGAIKFFNRLFNGEDKGQNDIIGELVYDNKSKATLKVPNQNSPQYQIQIQGQQPVQCFFIPSHRSIFRYQTIDNIPFVKKNKQSAFNEVFNATKNRYLGNNTQSPSYFMKNTLISWAIQGYGIQNNGKDIMPKDEEQIRHFEGFKNVLKSILPKTLNFEDFEIREREIVFICNNGNDEFVFEQASGGISALIDIAWQIYMFSTKEKTDFVVIIDEVENHLHPTMQRQILPNLIKAFPNARFVVSTHSPLIVGSVQESNVYVLRYDDDGKIVSKELDLVNQAKTATEILDEVLGVSFTMPVWAEEKLEEIVNKYSGKDVNNLELTQMRNDLKNIGLEKLMPEAICNVMDNKND